jgi:triphosphatase
VRHALVLFGGIVPRKATTLLRERCEAEAALAEAETAGGAVQRAAVSAKLR